MPHWYFKLFEFLNKSIFVNSTESCSSHAPLHKPQCQVWQCVISILRWKFQLLYKHRPSQMPHFFVLDCASDISIQTRNCYAHIRCGFFVIWNLVRLHFNCILILAWPLVFTWEPSQNFWRILWTFSMGMWHFQTFHQICWWHVTIPIFQHVRYPLWCVINGSIEMVQSVNVAYLTTLI